MDRSQTINLTRMDTQTSTLKEEPENRFGVTGVTGDNAPKGSVTRFRRKRFQLFLKVAHEIAPGRKTIEVADIGGAMDYWEGVRDLWGHLPLRITIFNIGEQAPDQGPYKFRIGDACDLSEIVDNTFDLVHSNSVIEHVGHWTQIEAMAREIRRLAPRYFIQTPNFGFPLEPHFRTLFFQWYPEVVRAGMLLRKSRGFYSAAKTMEDAMQAIQSVNLLTAGQMLHLFPDARLEREKLFGLTKSLISIR